MTWPATGGLVTDELDLAVGPVMGPLMGPLVGPLVGPVMGIGMDLVEVDRMRTAVDRTPGLVDRVFTTGEATWAAGARDPAQRLAARFAAKEAVLKALGVGLGAAPLRSIEVVRAPSGQPAVVLHDQASELADRLGVQVWHLSLTHTSTTAAAVAVAMGPPGGVGGDAGAVTPTEMAAIDAAAAESTAELIGRAGGAVARQALRMLGGAYGRRVVVVAGGGNNGNDGREAADRLRRAGVRVTVVDALAPPQELPRCDLVIDAAFGTGFRGSWQAPAPAAGTTPLVLAVDIVSGVDGLTGVVSDDTVPMAADATVTFAAMKPGLLLADGPALCGRVSVADIGLDTSGASITLLDDAGVAAHWPVRADDTHKWRSALWVVAGSPGMAGAAALVCAGAQRSGAGYVRLSIPGGGLDDGSAVASEVVRTALAASGWATGVVSGLDRFGAVVVGNGLGRDPAIAHDVATLVASSPVPVVVDADGLNLLAMASAHRRLGDHVVLTPHDGEYAMLVGDTPGQPGDTPGPDRIAAARKLAADTTAVVLLKGPTTVVAHPDGRVLLSTAGDARLATAGTGDVLAGVVGALCAQGVDPFLAAGMAAFCHGRAADLGWSQGLVAGDLPGLLPAVIAALAGGPAGAADHAAPGNRSHRVDRRKPC